MKICETFSNNKIYYIVPLRNRKFFELLLIGVVFWKGFPFQSFRGNQKQGLLPLPIAPNTHVVLMVYIFHGHFDL